MKQEIQAFGTSITINNMGYRRGNQFKIILNKELVILMDEETILDLYTKLYEHLGGIANED